MSDRYTGETLLFIYDTACNTLCSIVGKYYAGKVWEFVCLFNAIAELAITDL